MGEAKWQIIRTNLVKGSSMRQKLQNSKATLSHWSFCQYWGYIFTPHAQHERGKVIGLGVLVYIYMFVVKKIESYFSDRLTFSSIRGRTSRRIYRLVVLALLSLETLSSLNK